MTSPEENSTIGQLPPEADRRLRELYAYWESIRPGSDLLPGRQHFDPADVPKALPFLWLLDVTRDPLKFRYRVLGTVHAEAVGGNHVGRTLDEVVPDFESSANYPHYVLAAEQGVVVFRAGRPLVRKHLDYIWMERLLLPLARDGRTVDMILGMVAFPHFRRATR